MGAGLLCGLPAAGRQHLRLYSRHLQSGRVFDGLKCLLALFRIRTFWLFETAAVNDPTLLCTSKSCTHQPAPMANVFCTV